MKPLLLLSLICISMGYGQNPDLPGFMAFIERRKR